jgi:hypothetical protein
LGKEGSGKTVNAASVVLTGAGPAFAKVTLIFNLSGAKGFGPDVGFPDIPSIC